MLNDERKQEIIEWVSGHTSAQEDAEVRRLIAEDPEAAEYAQATRETQAAVRGQEFGSMPLSDEAARVIASQIRKRPRRLYSARGILKQKSTSWINKGAIAASLLLLATGLWWSISGEGNASIGQVGFFQTGASPHAEAKPSDIFNGDAISNDTRHAYIDLVNGSTVVLAELSRISINDDGNTITLEQGSVFVKADPQITVRIDRTEVALLKAQAKITKKPTEYVWVLYSGDAVISCQDQTQEVTGPKLVIWDRSESIFRVQPMEAVIPGWATQGLDKAKW